MKNKWALLFTACACLMFVFFAAALPAKAETSGDWEYEVRDGSATITGYTGKDKVLEVPDALDGIKVTAIGRRAFVENITLESVTIPKSVTTIGEGAFQECSSLTEIIFPDTLVSIEESAFASTKLKNVTIPDSVTFLGSYAFENCTGLRSVTIGSGILEWETDWGTNAAFRNCTLLSSLEFTDGLMSIGTYAFQGCSLLMEAFIPSSVTEIGTGAFDSCELLDTVEACGNIGDQAFRNCTSLKDIVLSDTCSIGELAFFGDTSLKEIALPETLTTIGQSAFEGCTKLSEIVIPDSVTTVDAFAFRGCTQLAEAVIGSGVAEWGTYWSESKVFEGCTKLTDVTIKDGCAYVPQGCFENCSALETIEIPGSCESIDDGAFRNCSALAEVILNDGLCYIRDEAFKDDSELVLADLPRSLLSIGNNAFYNTRMREVIIPDKVLSLGYGAFAENPALRTAYIGEGIEKWETSWGKNGAFENDVRLESVTIEEGCMYIGAYAFAGCSRLTSVEIPITATSVDESAFENCTSLAEVTIQRGKIGAKAFKGCESLTNLSLSRITEIGDEAFRGCITLYELEIPDTVTSIGGYAFYECISLAEIEIPESVTFMGAYAFGSCTGLVKAVVSNNITEWGSYWGDNYMFADDTSLRYVSIEDKANSLGDKMFANCPALEAVYLPDSIVSYTDELFWNCGSTLTVYSSGNKMKALAEECGVNFSTDDFEFPELETFTVAVTAGEGGMIAPCGEIEKLTGSTQAIVVTPAPGYMVDTYTIDGEEFDYWDPLTGIGKDHEIEVTFTEDPDYVEEYPLLDEDEEEPEDEGEDEPEEETEPEDEEPEEEDETDEGDAEDEDAELLALLGYIDDAGDYVNEFLGLKFHPADGWTFMTRDELLALSGITIQLTTDEQLAENMRQSIEDGSTIYCMQVSAALGSPNVNLNLQAMDPTVADYIDESMYLNIMSSLLEESLTSMGGQNIEFEISTVEFAGEETPCIRLSWELYGIPFYQCAVARKEGSYIALTTCTSLEEGQEDELLSGWSYLE
ncbi:MAG: leucine-rich repeat domain-containing protein [Lachnospiraceae bacterium]|nr:leucine-rich repeat domain-containing protein [Lachnospiraceae bacterium]